MKSNIKNELEEHIKTAQATLNFGSIIDSIEIASKICIDSLKNNKKILLIGNGGSAADAQHIAAELVGRYKNERKGLAALALTTDTSAITAVGNDYGYSRVFSRQIEALANEGDTLIGISTSGTSSNILSAIQTAKQLNCKTIGFSGRSGGKMNELCDVNLVIPAKDTARIQEMHIVLGHIICNLIDQEFS